MVLDSTEWETYLKDVDPDRSILKLRNALSLRKPVGVNEANWLNRIKDCPLFIEMCWHPEVIKNRNFPLLGEDLASFVKECALRWLHLANNVARGLIPFEEMEKNSHASTGSKNSV